MVGAIRGYNVVCTVAEKNEGEKLTLMNAQGIQLVKTPSSAKWDAPDSYFSVAYKMSEDSPNAYTLNQYDNISNALANYDQTAEEILEACENKLDVIVIGTGTGGTITGIANKIKEKVPSCKVVGVDPVGSLIAQPDEINEKVQPYKVEGLGHDFIPNTCVRKNIDSWVKTRDQESLDLARRMIKEEGLLVGSSCGSMLYGAIKYALDNNLDEKHRIVVVMPDSVRNYMTKFLSDDYMVVNGFLPLDTYKDPNHKLHGKTVKDLNLKQVKTYTKKINAGDALGIFTSGEDEIVIEKDGKIEGVILEAKFMTVFNEKKLNQSDTLESVNLKKVAVVTLETDLSIVEKLLQNEKLVLVQTGNEAEAKIYRITSKDILRLSI